MLPTSGIGNTQFAYYNFKNIHKDRVAFGGFFVEACRRPNPVEKGAI